MKAFSFRFDRILEHHRNLEDERKKEFIKAKEIYNEEVHKLVELKHKLQEIQTISKAPAWKLQQILFYKEKLNEDIILQESVVNKKTNEMLQKKQLMIDSHIEKRKFEILRDNEYKQYKQEEIKLEQKQNDEFYLSRYNHRG